MCALQELFAHDRYNDHHALLGFGDGELQHVDIRVTDKMSSSLPDVPTHHVWW